MGRNPELRQDPVTNRWVIFSPARAKRPTDYKSKSSETPNRNSCPFCIGNEHECAPEIFRIPDDPNNREWKVRVIQNMFPALDRELQNSDGCEHVEWGSVVDGFGYHDVVIESPLHSVQLCDMEPVEISQVLMAHKKRIEQIASSELIKYVQVFKNHGASAGASLSHSHSQILGLPIVPANVTTRLDCMKEYFGRVGKCSLCEVQKKDLLIEESANFISIVPFAATYPFEMWIIPINHSSHFHELDFDKARDLGGLLKLMLRKMNVQLNNPPFNFMIHTSPLQVSASQSAYCHWFLQIIPQLSGVGGFELGSGCYINPVFPEDAAEILKKCLSNATGKAPAKTLHVSTNSCHSVSNLSRLYQKKSVGSDKEGHKHLSALDEVVLKNIDACKQLSQITRTSLGPNGRCIQVCPRTQPSLMWTMIQKAKLGVVFHIVSLISILRLS